eukprot:TRINITY_DN3275_c0_g1_i1.p1 TRINITY_DN3275_c0_g1~~TRINITY_DN3275_c0_g1_i1.p1  ORF type:complete len:1123 (+),score=299.10 TRINITY_DN3275_c0_g1_i1:113-3481(+)
MSDADFLCAKFEKACLEFQVPHLQKEAEKVLLEFRKIPNVSHLCRLLLERSSHTVVRFQAVSTLRDSILKDWLHISRNDKENFRTFLLSFVFSVQLEPVVVKQVLQTTAIVCKRGWLEGDAESQIAFRNATFTQIEAILSSAESSNASKAIALQFLLALIDEFTYTRSNSAYGLTWEFHHRSMIVFQKGELRKVYIFGLQSLRRQMAIGNAADPNILRFALNVIIQVLSWRFEEPSLSKFNKISFKTSENTSNIIRPGENWRDLLLDDNPIQLFINLHQSLRSNMYFCNTILTGLAQLASISGKIFADDTAQRQYVSKLLNGLLFIMKSPGTLEEIEGISQIILRVTTNFKFSALMELPDLLGRFLGEFTGFTLNCLQFLQNSEDSDMKSATEDCFDVLLESWVLLLDETSKNATFFNSAAQNFVKEGTLRIFKGYAETRLHLARVELEDDDEETHDQEDAIRYNEQLNSIAYIGRVDILGAVQSVNALLEARISSFQNFVVQGPASGVNILHVVEEIHWLFLICGHLVCDCVDGETPQIPFAVNSLSKQCQTPEGDPVVVLLWNLFKIMNMDFQLLHQGHSDALSPLLGKTQMWFLECWLPAYLMTRQFSSNGGISPNIVKTYGEESNGGAGLQVLDFIVQKAILNLEKWSGELHLLQRNCKVLLLLSQMPQTPAYLLRLPAFLRLLQLHTQSDSLLQKLPAGIQRTFMAALVSMTDNVAAGADEEDEEAMETARQKRSQYFFQVVNPVVSQFTSLLQQPDFVKVSQSPAVLFQIQRLLECFRGIIRASISETSTIFSVCSRYFNSWVELVGVYRNNPEVVVQIFKLFKDFTECQSENLEGDEQATTLFQSIGALFRKYAECNVGKRKVATSAAQRSENENDVYKDVRTLLKLLCMVCGNINNWQVQVEEVTVYGVSSILPLIRELKELLEFPKLCLAYFTLVNTLFSECPRKVVSLDPNLFKSLLLSLEFGVNHFDVEIARRSLEAVIELLKYNIDIYKDLGSFALQDQCNANPELMLWLLQFVMNFILFSDFSADLVELAADALFYLIFVQQENYMKLVNMIIEKQGDNTVNKQKLVGAFTELMSKDNFELTLEKKNIEIFRKNMPEFLLSVKSFLLTK